MAKMKRTVVHTDDDEPRGGRKMDPIIQGLFERLPRPGAVWKADERQAWLTMMQQAFNVIYLAVEPPEDSDIP
jgi:hypothetical protein